MRSSILRDALAGIGGTRAMMAVPAARAADSAAPPRCILASSGEGMRAFENGSRYRI
jgi:hypothetical protein